MQAKMLLSTPFTVTFIPDCLYQLDIFSCFSKTAVIYYVQAILPAGLPAHLINNRLLLTSAPVIYFTEQLCGGSNRKGTLL